MAARSPSIDEVLAILASTPRSVAAVTSGLGPLQLRNAPCGEWSALEVLAHLRACADVWGGCILRILREERPTIKAVNPRSWIKETNYTGMDFKRSPQAFTAQRAELLAVLQALRQRERLRAAVVTGAGKPLERSVLLYAQWMARHERPHVKQIARIVDRAGGHVVSTI